MQSVADHTEGSALSRCFFYLQLEITVQVEAVCSTAHLHDVWSALWCVTAVDNRDEPVGLMSLRCCA